MFEFWMLVICLWGTVCFCGESRRGESGASRGRGRGGGPSPVGPRRMYYISFVFSFKLIHFLFGDSERGLTALWRGHDFKLDLLF